MEKLIQSLSDHQAPIEFTRSDWKDLTVTLFTPYFQRKTQLFRNIDSFILEARNLARLLNYPEHLNLLQWCLKLHRRVLRNDREGTYATLYQLFENTQESDKQWVNMFYATNPLERDASPYERVFQLFETINGVAEGCFKPQLQILYAFAVRDRNGVWPQQIGSLDFGKLVGNFPHHHRQAIPNFLHDPDLKIAVNQWRNIAAHKSYEVVGPQTIEVTFGKNTPHRRKFGIRRLSAVSSWLLRTHHAVRLANVITYIEHMKEILSYGQPNQDRQMSVTVLSIGHDLSTVGFEVVSWKVNKQEGILSIKDRGDRDPIEALIHASQQLVQLGIGVLRDVTIRSKISKVSIQLIKPEGIIFGKAQTSVANANAYSLREIDLASYMNNLEFVKSQ